MWEQLDLGCFVGLEFELCLEAVALAGLGRSWDGPRYIAGTVLSMVTVMPATLLKLKF